MSYTFDGQPKGAPLTGDIATQFLGGSNFAYVGFGAGTGGLSNVQSVRNVNITATAEGQTPGNRPPTAVADAATTAAGTAVVIAVLANDSDPDNDPLVITGVSNPVNGTATINGDNTITYTPNPGFSGSGGFTYSISDGTKASSAPVSVTVTSTSPGVVVLAPHGSASVADNVFTLTNAPGQAGTAMSTGRIDVREDFTVAFDVNLGANDATAPTGRRSCSTTIPVALPRSERSAVVWGFPVSRTGRHRVRYLRQQRCRGAWFRHRRRSHRFPRHQRHLRDDAGGFAQHRGRCVACVVVTWDASSQTMSYTFDGQPRERRSLVTSPRSSSADRTSPMSASAPAQAD